MAGCSVTSTDAPSTTIAGQVGSKFTLNDGTGDTIDVTLLKFEDPATPASKADAPPAGDNLAEVLITITGVSGTYKDAASTAVAVIGSDHNVYSAGPERLAGCTSFKPGEFTLVAGKSLTGCVAVEIKKTVKPVKIEYDAGYVGTTGIWLP
jgi:hypothetical protein